MTIEPTPTPTPAGVDQHAPSPFAGIPVSDLVRDGAALLLLLISFALPWNITSSGIEKSSGHVAVILVTVLSIVSLSVTYLAHAKVFGPGLSGAKAGLIRAAANAPYAIVVAVFLIIDISHMGDKFYQAGGGIGYGAAFGLAGAALAGMPRQTEADGSSASRFQATVMRLAVPALAGLWVVMSFINLITIVFDYASDSKKVALTLALIIQVVIVLAPLALLAFGLFRRSAATRTAAIAGGGVVFGVMTIDWLSDWDLSRTGVESVHLPAFGLIAFVTLGVLASSHLFRDAMRPVDDVKRLVSAASILILAQGALVIALMLNTILALIADIGLSVGKALGYIFTLLIIAALAGTALMLVRSGKASTRLLAMGLVAATMIVGMVSMILVNSMHMVSPVNAIYAFGLPVATLALLLVPASMRAHYGSPFGGAGATAAVTPAAPMATPLAPASAPLAPHTTETVDLPAPIAEVTAVPVAPPAYVAPTVPPAVPAAPVHPRSAEAADPATPLAALFDIASNIPELRAAVASNPSTYPDLLTWLGQLGDAAVDGALKARGA